MLSPRRIRLAALAAVAVIFLYLYYSGEGRSVQNQRFYQSTVAAIDAQKSAKAGDNAVTHKDPSSSKLAADHDEHDRVEPAIPKAHDSQDTTPDYEAMEEIPIAGRTKMTVPKDRNEVSKNEKQEQPPPQQELSSEVDEQEEVKAELNSILKRSPIIIFSKSYCPYSKRAKSILLEKYTIVPTPFVVELDQHPLGSKLQAFLGEKTGRHTVPNILVNAESIGGGDDVAALHEHDELTAKLKSLGRGGLQEVSRKLLEE